MVTPGEILKNKRRSLGKTIFEVSQETKILEKYIRQIESNQFELFDSPVFARGFIKIYSEYLSLDTEKILALFRRDNKELVDSKIKGQRKRSLLNMYEGNVVKTLIIIGTIILVFLFSIFLFIKLKNYQETPTIQILSPANGYQSNEKQITIEGLATKKSILNLNGNNIQNTNGTFKENINLNVGENNIVLKAQNNANSNKKSELVLKIYYEEPKIVNYQIPVIDKYFNVQLKVSKQPSWVKLVVDGKQKLAQIVDAGFNETYKFKTDLEVVTGRIDNTTVIIGGKTRLFKLDSKTGVATLVCSVENNEVNCSE